MLTHRARAFVPAWVRAGWWPPLPGGRGVRRWARVPGWVDDGLAPAVAAAICTALAWRLGHRAEALILVAGVALAAGRLVPVVWPAPVRDRHVARRADHPDLLAIVAEVADELGVRRPSRVCLAPVAESGGIRLGPRRTELWIGLPYLLGFERAELRTVIAFELVFLEARRAWLLAALLEVWKSGTRMKPAVLQEIGEVVRALVTEADMAGRRVSDPRTAANAVLRGALMSASFDWFVHRYAADLSTHRYLPLDLYQAWRWKVYQDDLLARLMPRYLELSATGSLGLDATSRMTELGVVLDQAPRPAADPIMSTPGLAVEARFARCLLGDVLTGAPAMRRELTFPDVPETVWDEIMKRRYDQVLRAAAELTGRERLTLADLVEILAAGHGAELVREHREWACTHPTAGVCVLLPVLHHHLRMKGYRYGQALRRRELIGPGGDRVDVARLAEAIERGHPIPEMMPVRYRSAV
ncbi:hypothetical protein [Microbispora triticiradicis]|uniref:hypothetical protein n=1 Tax=Microbispora triticiradicis TaxID=2200763 RepID=UPI001AD7178F|nr:hypothetical protein [Microbispora triticiradicis]MBO4271565.1 hypothetical protein [Microbispora triticiradicis]